MSIGTMLFNPFTGKPRDPRDIASDPKGILVWDGEEPLRAAPRRAATEAAEPVAWLRDQRGEYEGRETLDTLFMLGAIRPQGRHGATYSPLYAAPPAAAEPVAPAAYVQAALVARSMDHPSVLEIMADCADCVDTENSAQHDQELCGNYDGAKWIEAARSLREKAAAIRAEDPEIWPALAAPDAAGRDALDAADLLALQRFADAIMEDWTTFGELDGLDRQNIAERCGLLVQRTVTEPCGDSCGCAEAGASFPTDCYFETAILHRASRAAALSTTGGRTA